MPCVLLGGVEVVMIDNGQQPESPPKTTARHQPTDCGDGREAGPIVKTVVIGASGYVGNHLWRAYRLAYPDSLGTTFSTANSDLAFFDIRRRDIHSLSLAGRVYPAVLIASAKPNITFCEQQKDAAYAVNVRGMLELIRQLGQTSLQVIFLSSDYVFEGSTGGYGDDTE